MLRNIRLRIEKGETGEEIELELYRALYPHDDHVIGATDAKLWSWLLKHKDPRCFCTRNLDAAFRFAVDMVGLKAACFTAMHAAGVEYAREDADGGRIPGHIAAEALAMFMAEPVR